MTTVNSAVFGGQNSKSSPVSVVLPNLVTVAPNDWIFVFVFSFNSPSVSISDNVGLSWIKRISYTNGSNYWGTEFYAKAPAASTYAITVTNNAGTYVEAWAADVSGLPSALPVFDPNASLPATVATNTPATISTIDNTGVVFGFFLDPSGTSTFTPGAGFTMLPAAGATLMASAVEYKTVSTPQVNLSVPISGGQPDTFSIADAIGPPNPNFGVLGLAAAEW